MSEQQNNTGASHNIPQQSSNFPLSGQTMEGMDVMNMGQISMTNPTPVGAAGDSLDSLAPIFPPQNFEVPDISFSNSVSPNADFNQSMFSSAHVLGTSNSLYTNVTAPSGHMMSGQPITSSGQQQGQQMSYFPPASNSPPGTSSSEDSDDLPLAQLAKRATGPPGSTTPPTTTTGSTPSPTASTTTNDASPDNSPSQVAPAKKGKSSKRKKRKDPNEPQKPVSAYALFFRDTQATIKGHNPGASFGEVSKIVASMWDQLDPDHKDVYKKKTEMAKKQYLKQLAAYRASQVSQSAAEEAEKSPSPPGMNVAPPVMGGNQVGVMPVTSSLHPMGAGPAQGGQVMTTAGMPVTMAGQMMNQQLQQQQMLPMTPQMMQQQQQQQHMQQMQHQMQHQQQMRMQQQQQMTMGQQASPSPPQQQQQHSPTQQQQSSPPAPTYNSPPHVGQAGPTNYQSGMVDHNMFGFSQPGMEMDMSYPHCVRNGCGNHARENPAWDSEYCSNDCVITHCRDIFTNWVAGRSGSNTFPVK